MCACAHAWLNIHMHTHLYAQMFISLHTIIVEYCLKFLIYFGLGFIDVEGNVFQTSNLLGVKDMDSPWHRRKNIPYCKNNVYSLYITEYD